MYYMYDQNGIYVGSMPKGKEDFPPDNCLLIEPETRPGYWPVRNAVGDNWDYAEDNRGAEGYVGTERIVIRDLGPLPDCWSETPPDPRTPEEIRRAEIYTELARIDSNVIRPMRAQLAGTATDEDEVIVAQLEWRAQVLREELEALQSESDN